MTAANLSPDETLVFSLGHDAAVDLVLKLVVPSSSCGRPVIGDHASRWDHVLVALLMWGLMTTLV